MKNFKTVITTILLIVLTIGCSSNDEIETNADLIIGKWTLESEQTGIGVYKNLSDCNKRNSVTFKDNGTFGYKTYSTDTNEMSCILDDEENNIVFTITDDILEWESSYIYNDQTIVEFSNVKIEFPDRNTLKIHPLNDDDFSENYFETYIRSN